MNIPRASEEKELNESNHSIPSNILKSNQNDDNPGIWTKSGIERPFSDNSPELQEIVASGSGSCASSTRTEAAAIQLTELQNGTASGDELDLYNWQESPSRPSSQKGLSKVQRNSGNVNFAGVGEMSALALGSSPVAGTGSYGTLSTLVDDTSMKPDVLTTSSSPMDDTGNVGIRDRSNKGGNTIGKKDQNPAAESERHAGNLNINRLDGVTELESEDTREFQAGEEDGLRQRNDVHSEDEEEVGENPPYPEVSASVLPYDDTTLSTNTPRMWFLSILFSLLGSSTNLFFSLRYPSISISPVIALLLAHPLGLLWDRLFSEKPTEDNDINRDSANKGKLYKLRRWLGRGRWNRKEHCCVYISSNVSFGFAFATDVIVEQTHFYHQDLGIMYQILLTLSTQVLGYAFAGLTRQWLVYPGGMIWPGTLMSTAMFTTLHGEENKVANGWKITRWKFFMIIFLAGFLWYFVPGLLAPCLSYFSVVTWFAPKNVIIANLFGVASGLGMFPMTFDWAQISYIGSPLMTPFWAAANVVSGLVVVMWIIAPIMYYKNVFFSAYMPILSSIVFDNTGRPYDVSKILTKDFLFDDEGYKRYSKVFMPITYVLSYGLQFAALTALVTHTICWHGKDIWRQWKLSREESGTWGKAEVAYTPLHNGNGRAVDLHSKRNKPKPQASRNQARERRRTSADGQALRELAEKEDIHMRMMRRYNEAPMSWYLITFGFMLIVGIYVVEYYPIHLPWYGLLLALGICGVFFVPIGIVMAITNQQSSLFLVCQLICGTVFPGRPVANMVFVTYGYITSTQGLKFASDLKLGHYMKIPPRLLFFVQMVATIISSLAQIGVLNWMFRHIKGICTPKAINGFTCPIARVHFNGSILWGVVGPAKFFGKDELYRPLIWAFLIGAAAPVGIWLIGRRTNRGSVWRKINLPVVFGSLSWIPPATGLNFSVWTLVCFVFNSVLRRKANAWWGKYTMTLSAALDASVAFSLVIIFFGFVYPGWMGNFHWWGTEIYKQGCDWQACPYKTLPPGEHFGPDVWS